MPLVLATAGHNVATLTPLKTSRRMRAAQRRHCIRLRVHWLRAAQRRRPLPALALLPVQPGPRMSWLRCGRRQARCATSWLQCGTKRLRCGRTLQRRPRRGARPRCGARAPRQADPGTRLSCRLYCGCSTASLRPAAAPGPPWRPAGGMQAAPAGRGEALRMLQRCRDGRWAMACTEPPPDPVAPCGGARRRGRRATTRPAPAPHPGFLPPSRLPTCHRLSPSGRSSCRRGRRGRAGCVRRVGGRVSRRRRRASPRATPAGPLWSHRPRRPLLTCRSWRCGRGAARSAAQRCESGQQLGAGAGRAGERARQRGRDP